MFEYGDVIERYRWRSYFSRWGKWRLTFRFRIDPVPFTGIGKYRFAWWYKRPHYMNEKRQYYNYDPQLVRGKRHPKYLPNAWDNYQRGDVKTRKSWKSKKIRKQWMKNMGVKAARVDNTVSSSYKHGGLAQW